MNSQFKKFRRSLEAVINEKANKIANETSAKIVEAFTDRAKKKLEDYAVKNALDSSSIAIVNRLKENISYVSEKSGRGSVYSYVRVKNDPDGLMMFLEYGTGLQGSKNYHPEAGKRGWKYAINRDKYVRLQSAQFSDVKGYGWFFRKKPDSFLTKDDIPIHRYEKVGQVEHKISYIRKDTGKLVEYTRTYKKKMKDSKSIFSQGLKPARFIYDTKQEFKNLFKETKGLTVSELEKKLEIMKLK